MSDYFEDDQEKVEEVVSSPFPDIGWDQDLTSMLLDIRE